MLICWILKAGNGFSYPVLVAYKKKNVTEFDMLQINALFWKTTLFAGKKTLCASKIYFQLFHSYPLLALKFIILIWQADTQLKTHDLVDTRSKVNDISLVPIWFMCQLRSKLSIEIILHLIILVLTKAVA